MSRKTGHNEVPPLALMKFRISDNTFNTYVRIKNH